MISASRYPENIIDVDIDRYIPKISHDIFGILDTIPNTTSKQFRTHTRGYANIPPSWLHTAYTAAVVPIVLGIFSTHSIPSRLNQPEQPYGPNQPRAFASHRIQALVTP